MYHLIRPALFALDPETAHQLVLSAASLPFADTFAASTFPPPSEKLKVEAFGKSFISPVGIAAGFDKNCEAVSTLAALGFSHVEVGTITPRAQSGNPKPRMFRFSEARAVVNRLGFPSIGVDALLKRLSFAKDKTVLGINIGKMKDTPLDKAIEDYLYCFNKVSSLAGYVAINVSSPNTPDLRALQQKNALKDLLGALQQSNTKNVPLLVKIAPDLTFQEIDEIVEAAIEAKISGIIATNTTVSREDLPAAKEMQGGLSGVPLFKRSLEVVRHVSKRCQKKLTVIGVGGISSADDVILMLKAGASLVQLYTALIFHGPGLISRINQDLLDYMRKERLSSLSEISSVV